MTPAEGDESLTRRQMLATSGAVGIGAGAVLLGCGDGASKSTTSVNPAAPATTPVDTSAAPAACVLSPEQTEGPYYIADSMLRRNITEGRPGTPLRLELTVQRVTACEPIEDATVEVWHADASGEYSGFGASTGSRTFLRGGQKTDAEGLATIDTIFPGWYRGRATHIHVKVHAGGDQVHTGQLYFDDAAAAKIFATEPYSGRGQADQTNAGDGIYSQGGQASTVKLDDLGRGYVGRLTLGVRT